MFAYSPAKNLSFHFEHDPKMPALLAKLEYCKKTSPSPDSIAICCYVFTAPLHGLKWNFYKGIPWRVQVLKDSQGNVQKILFQALFFRTFLFFRLILLPLLWRMALKEGGFYLLGTAYSENNITYLLFANPGAGKTRCLLRWLQTKPIRFIGDGSLLYLPQRGILPVLTEIELRYKTIRWTSFWKFLPCPMRIRLYLYNLISFLTHHYISFNVTLSPKQLDIEYFPDTPTAPHRIMRVLSADHIKTVDPKEIKSLVMDYLYKYHKHYKNIFSDNPYDETIRNLQKFIHKFYQ